MKKLTTICGAEYIKNHVNAWCRTHGKAYLTNEFDLEHLTKRYRKHISRAKCFAGLLALSTLVFLGGWMYKSPEQQTSDNIWATITLTVVIWLVTRVMLGDARKDRELFDSLKQFHSDWVRLEELNRKMDTNGLHLTITGQKIAEAERLQDGKTKDKLMKQFKRDHKVLTNFGVCSGGYENYIPSSKKKEKVRATLRQVIP